MRGQHRAPRISAETRERRRLRARRGVSILVVTLLATIPVGVSAAMVPTTTVSSTSADVAEAQTGRSLVDRGSAFDVIDGRRATAAKSVDSTVAAAGLPATAMGVGAKTAAPVDTSCGAGLGAGAALAPPSVCAVTEPAGTNWSVFDPGNIIPDGIFYDTAAMSDVQIRDFIDAQGIGCTGPYCLKNLRVTTQDQPADQYCSAYAGAVNEDAAAVLGKVSRACGVNPQVMLVTLQKESGLLGRTDPTASTYDAAWGWHCPDTGPGGSANCDPAHAGFFNQAYGMAKQWSRYRVDPFNYNYRAGQTVDILRNVVESGCGSAPVTIANTATASLYNYTPYQPSAAALASYPGTGDACSAYGNRNFFFLFGKYFGDTYGQPSLGGTTRTGGGGTLFTARVASINSPAMTEVTIPNNGFVDPALAGRVITAPTASVAAGLAAGFSALGLPYVWGGGGSGAGPNNGCSRGGGALNSCGSEIGFDCSGLTAFVLGRSGFIIPGDSSGQRAVGTRITWDRALPGDVVGFPGHVAIYLGSVSGVRYILEASTVGTPVHIVKLTRTDADPQVYRFWAGIPQIGVDGSTFIPASPWSGAGGAGAGRAYYSTIPRYFPVVPTSVAPTSVAPTSIALAPVAAAPAPALPATTVSAPPTVPASPATQPSPTAATSASDTPTAASPTTASPTGAPATSASSTTAPTTAATFPPAPTTTAQTTTTPITAPTTSGTTASGTTTAPTTTAPTTAASDTAEATTGSGTATTTAGPGTTTAASTPASTEPAAPATAAETTVPAPATSAETPTIPAAPGATAPVAPTPDAPPPPAPSCLVEPATTVSIPTAPPTPSVLPKASGHSAPIVEPTLFMTIVALATSAMTGAPADPAEPLTGTC